MKKTYVKSVGANMKDVLGESVAGWIPILLFQLVGHAGEGLKGEVANRLVAVFIAGLRTDKILRSDDLQEDIASIVSALVPNPIQRRITTKGLEEFMEEAVKLQDAFDKNESGAKEVTERNVEKAKALLLGLAPTGGGDESEAKKEEKAAPAQSAKQLEKTFMQIVAGLDSEQQDTLWETVGKIRNDLPTGDERRSFAARLSRVAMTREQVAAILTAPVGLREDLLKQAVEHAISVGGVAGGFRRLMDDASQKIEHMIGADRHSPSTLLKDWKEMNDGHKAKRLRRNGVR